jgi:SET domain-containing protein
MIPGKGYDVIADRPIPQRTLICEYVGEVVTHRECIELESRSKNDSLMELQAGKNSDETLFIRP